MLELKYTPLSELKFLDGNSKLHDIGELCQLFKRHGFKEPLVWDRTADAIVSGNGRLQALLQIKDAGESPPDNIKVIDGEWAVPVIYGGDAETLEAAIAYSIDANLSVLGGGDFTVAEMMRIFDTDALFEQLQELTDIKMSPITFDENCFEEMNEILMGAESSGDWEEKEEDEDELSEVLDNVGKVESRVKLGEIWQLGRHRIACGDSTIESNVRALLGDKRIDLLATDPPYGVKVVGGTKDPRSKDYQSGKSIQNDDIQGDELREFLLKCFKATDSVMRDGACYYIAHPDIFAYEFIGAIRDTGWRQARPSVVLWVKDSFVFGQGDYHSRSEPILYGWKPGAAHKPVSDRTQDNVWEYGRPRNTKEMHPSVKPTELIEKMIVNSSEPGWLVYDPFLGSGTTIIAAQKMEGDRTVYGFELSPDYCEVIIQRFENFTGQVAKKVGAL
jgi:DNA modification methylase